MSWSYERTESSFESIPVGKYRIRIKDAEKAQSKNGNDMLKLTFQVSGLNQLLFHYIVFLDDRPEITNRMFTQFFDAFPGIEEGNFQIKSWIGQMGACVVAVDKNDDTRTRLSYFIKADKQAELPAWVEPSNSTAQAPVGADGFADLSNVDSDIPFI